jgi:DNA-3-methyladenine glycosylase II
LLFLRINIFQSIFFLLLHSSVYLFVCFLIILISVPIPPNFSFTECLWFLDRNYDDCVHTVEGNVVRKVISDGENLALIEISEKDNCLNVNILKYKISEKYVKNFVEEWFDLERDILPFYAVLKKDADFKFMTTDFNGLRLLGIPNAFEALSWCIIGQQINLTFAYSLKRRLTEAYGTKITFEGKNYWSFPDPEIISKLKPEDLRIFQFSQKKAEYVIEAGKQFAEGNISKEILAELSTEDAIKKLTAIRGIGEWTANYLLMKSLRRQECITHGDVGLFNALVKLKNFPKRPEKQQILDLFADYQGWEAYLVFYLWRSLAERRHKQ